jgi:very-short-patch-repair endonuclease
VDTKTLKFIYNSKKLYEKEYNFSYNKTKYINSRTNLIITCPIHGDIEISPNNHINSNRSCKKCNEEKRREKEWKLFLEKSKEKHNDFYSYEKSIYIGSKNNIIITCPIHGEFKQTPNSHISGKGCPECKPNYKLTKNEFIKRSTKKHNHKNYDYSLVEYINSSTEVKIICPVHGIFKQIPNSHLLGYGCKKCSYEINAEKRRYNIEELQNKFHKIHKNKYTYNMDNYKNIDQRIKITCPIHGEFKQMGTHHLNGHGCPKCNKSKGEILISEILEDFNIEYLEQYKFKDCKNKRCLPFDFYLPKYNICIEFDGRQHFEIFELFGEESFKNTIKNDKIKNKYCSEKGIKLIRIKYNLGKKKIKQIIKEII